jgi:hypothetical protein
MKNLVLIVLAFAFALSTTACVPWWDHHDRRGYDRGDRDRGEHYERR